MKTRSANFRNGWWRNGWRKALQPAQWCAITPSCWKFPADNGRVTGARLRDLISGQEYAVQATQCCECNGPVGRRGDLGASGISTPRMIGGVRGSHLVLPKFAGAPKQAIYTEAIDGRPIFVIPWNGQFLVGTSEVADSNAPDNPQPSAEERDYLFQSFARLFPHSGLTPADIRYDFAGIRPLPFAPGKASSAVTRKTSSA